KTLEIAATGGMSVAALPIAAHEGDLILELDVDLRRIEWGGGLVVGITSPTSEQRALAIEFLAMGGQGDQTYQVGCISGWLVNPTWFPIDLARPQPLGRHRVRAVLRPESRILTCTVVDGEGVELAYKRVAVEPEGAVRAGVGELQIATRSIADESPLVSAALHRVSVIGAKIDERRGGDPQPLLAARRALAEGDHVGALAALDGDATIDVPEAERALWRLRALIYLGRWREAMALLGPWLADPERREAIEGGLGLLLRAAPDDVLPLLRELEEPAALRRRIADALGNAFLMRRRDHEIVEELRRALEDYRPAPGEDPGESTSLLELRAEVYSVLNLPAQARRDFAEARAYRERSLAEEPARLQRDRATLILKEATEAARAGDRAAARELLAEAIRVPQQRALVEDMVAAKPELAALRVDGR
ncbi:MAG: hypothetical protein KC420_10150, partial [Myxococcales bacterium]|nr:hypothetical protein [Myxococcales bacterium]